MQFPLKEKTIILIDRWSNDITGNAAIHGFKSILKMETNR